MGWSELVYNLEEKLEKGEKTLCKLILIKMNQDPVPRPDL
jgi:hypothetical protein